MSEFGRELIESAKEAVEMAREHAACAAHTETPEERQRKLDEARKRVQQGQMAAQALGAIPFKTLDKCPVCGSYWGHMSGSEGWCLSCKQYRPAVIEDRPASAMPPWGNWPNILQPPAPIPPITVSSETKITHPDFGAQVSDQLAQQRGIDPKAANDHMRVRTFEEQEAERARMAEHFRKAGIL